jgi:hypothetical protein
LISENRLEYLLGNNPKQKVFVKIVKENKEYKEEDE